MTVVLTVLAVVVALAVAAFGVTLPGITLRGAVLGGLFVVAGMFTWTFTDRPIVIWAVLAVEGVIFAIWAWQPIGGLGLHKPRSGRRPQRSIGGLGLHKPRSGRRPPWLSGLRALPKLGTAWLGLAYWLLGVIGALLTAHLSVGAQRLAYAGVFTLAALAVLGGGPFTAKSVRRGPLLSAELSGGMVAAVVVGLAALVLAGAGNLFQGVHAVPDGDPSTLLMRDRFWGGPLLYFHPNSMAGLAVLVAVRIGPDRRYAVWQRLAALGVTGFFLYLTNSRIAFVFAGFAALLHAGLLWWRRRPEGLPEYRRRWLAAATPFAVLALVLVLSGGQGFLFRDRFGGNDVTSGRVDTWKQVATDWQHAGWAEKLFGDARTARAVVTRTNDGRAPDAERRKLNTDNAAVGAFRRGGLLGALAFLFGLALLVWHAVFRRPGAAWFTVAALGALPTIATEDWLLGGTNGALWLLLLAGEALVCLAPQVQHQHPVAAAR